MYEIPIAGGGHMRDERPCVTTVCVVVHHVIGVCLAEKGGGAGAPLQVCILSLHQPYHMGMLMVVLQR